MVIMSLLVVLGNQKQMALQYLYGCRWINIHGLGLGPHAHTNVMKCSCRYVVIFGIYSYNTIKERRMIYHTKWIYNAKFTKSNLTCFVGHNWCYKSYKKQKRATQMVVSVLTTQHNTHGDSARRYRVCVKCRKQSLTHPDLKLHFFPKDIRR